MKNTIAAILLLVFFTASNAQDSIALYPDAIPGGLVAHNIEVQLDRGKGDMWASKVSQPTLTVFLPPKASANGTAVIICPGGSYSSLALTKEGYLVAKELNKLGIAAFILKYRLPDDRIMKDKATGPLQDAQTGIRIIRQRAKEWNIDTNKVGIMGFSAGGHLASTVITHFATAADGSLSKVNLRPDFAILIYPVISFSDSLTHMGSRNNLIGKTPSDELKNLYSNELQVSPQTPPTLLIHAGDDKAVKVENSIRFYEALHQNGVSAEMLLYPKGGHGFGLFNPTTTDNWMERCRDWMKSQGFLGKGL